MPKAKAGQNQDTAPEQQAVPIVFTIVADQVWASGTATVAPYSWSKDGAAASNSQWTLPAGQYDVAVNWTIAGVAVPAVAGKAHAYTTTWGTAFTPDAVWVDNGNGTTTGTVTATGRVTYSIPLDVRYNADFTASNYPMTLKAGSTVTLTPVLTAAPPVHTISDITPTTARANWSPSGVRDIEVDGTIVSTTSSGMSITGLAPATTYSTRTRADNPESEWTAAVPLTTIAKYPAPAAPTFTGIAPTEFTVQWTPAGRRSTYVDGVVYNNNSNSGVRVMGRTPGTTYSVQTEQVDTLLAPISEKSAAGSVTTTAPPAVPTGVAVTDIDTTGFTVSCDVSPGATAYEVRTTVVEGAP